MATELLNEAQLAALRELDTPTICNALEVLLPERRAYGYTEETFECVEPTMAPMVGYARTATIRSLRPGDKQGDAMREQRMAYYRYVQDGPAPGIAVIQDLDGGRAGYGSFWGEVNTAVHRALGCLGGITDGSMRDLGDIAPGFQLLARKVVPSHAFVHLEDFGCQVNVCGMVARSGDLIHADRHGAVVIPHEVAADVAGAAETVAGREKHVLDAVRDPNFTFDMLEAAFAEMTKGR